MAQGKLASANQKHHLDQGGVVRHQQCGLSALILISARRRHFAGKPLLSLGNISCFSQAVRASLRSRRLEVAGERENGRARGRHARGEGASRVSFSRARIFLCPLLPSACYAGY